MNLEKRLVRYSVLMVPLAAVMMWAGCSSAPRRYDVQIAPAPEVASGSVSVDIIGAASSDLDEWKSYSINKYWQEGDKRRQDAKKVTLRTGTSALLLLPASHPIWESWLGSGVDHLVVIADLPGSFEDGPLDPRRKILDLYPDAWKKGVDKLEIEIQESRIRILTPERRPKK